MRMTVGAIFADGLSTRDLVGWGMWEIDGIDVAWNSRMGALRQNA